MFGVYARQTLAPYDEIYRTWPIIKRYIWQFTKVYLYKRKKEALFIHSMIFASECSPISRRDMLCLGCSCSPYRRKPAARPNTPRRAVSNPFGTPYRCETSHFVRRRLAARCDNKHFSLLYRELYSQSFCFLVKNNEYYSDEIPLAEFSILCSVSSLSENTARRANEMDSRLVPSYDNLYALKPLSCMANIRS